MKINFRDLRTQLAIVAAVLLLIDAGAVILLLSPAGRSRGARQRAYEELKQERQEKAAANLPAQGMDQKIVLARQQEGQFVDERFASHYSTVSEQIAKMASEAGVQVASVRYDVREQNSKTTPRGYDAIGITINIKGTYDQNLRFINAVERQKMMLMIDAVGFGGMQGDDLTVSVHLTTYLRSAA